MLKLLCLCLTLITCLVSADIIHDQGPSAHPIKSTRPATFVMACFYKQASVVDDFTFEKEMKLSTFSVYSKDNSGPNTFKLGFVSDNGRDDYNQPYRPLNTIWEGEVSAPEPTSEGGYYRYDLDISGENIVLGGKKWFYLTTLGDSFINHVFVETDPSPGAYFGACPFAGPVGWLPDKAGSAFRIEGEVYSTEYVPSNSSYPESTFVHKVERPSRSLKHNDLIRLKPRDNDGYLCYVLYGLSANADDYTQYFKNPSNLSDCEYWVREEAGTGRFRLEAKGAPRRYLKPCSGCPTQDGYLKGPKCETGSSWNSNFGRRDPGTFRFELQEDGFIRVHALNTLNSYLVMESVSKKTAFCSADESSNMIYDWVIEYVADGKQVRFDDSVTIQTPDGRTACIEENPNFRSQQLSIFAVENPVGLMCNFTFGNDGRLIVPGHTNFQLFSGPHGTVPSDNTCIGPPSGRRYGLGISQRGGHEQAIWRFNQEAKPEEDYFSLKDMGKTSGSIHVEMLYDSTNNGLGSCDNYSNPLNLAWKKMKISVARDEYPITKKVVNIASQYAGGKYLCVNASETGNAAVVIGTNATSYDCMWVPIRDSGDKFIIASVSRPGYYMGTCQDCGDVITTTSVCPLPEDQYSLRITRSFEYFFVEKTTKTNSYTITQDRIGDWKIALGDNIAASCQMPQFWGWKITVQSAGQSELSDEEGELVTEIPEDFPVDIPESLATFIIQDTSDENSISTIWISLFTTMLMAVFL